MIERKFDELQINVAFRHRLDEVNRELSQMEIKDFSDILKICGFCAYYWKVERFGVRNNDIADEYHCNAVIDGADTEDLVALYNRTIFAVGRFISGGSGSYDVYRECPLGKWSKEEVLRMQSVKVVNRTPKLLKCISEQGVKMFEEVGSHCGFCEYVRVQFPEGGIEVDTRGDGGVFVFCKCPGVSLEKSLVASGKFRGRMCKRSFDGWGYYALAPGLPWIPFLLKEFKIFGFPEQCVRRIVNG